MQSIDWIELKCKEARSADGWEIDSDCVQLAYYRILKPVPNCNPLNKDESIFGVDTVTDGLRLWMRISNIKDWIWNQLSGNGAWVSRWLSAAKNNASVANTSEEWWQVCIYEVSRTKNYKLRREILFIYGSCCSIILWTLESVFENKTEVASEITAHTRVLPL